MTDWEVTLHYWDADEHLPYGLRVMIHPTVEHLQGWRIDHLGADPDSDVVASTHKEGDVVNIHLAADSLVLSVIAHEVAHWALFQYSIHILEGIPHASAKAHITNHGELLANLMGNATACIYMGLANLGYKVE